MKKVVYIAIVMMLAGCTWVQPKHQDGVAVELDGRSLSFAELDDITRSATSPADSAQMAETYIYQWATDILEYDEARDRANEDIERLVEDYRRSLYIHDYEQKLIARHQPKQWPDSVVENIYAQQQNHLRLRESIVKGVLLVVPQGAPKINYLKNWLGHLTDANIEKIEKYAFQYASGYEYFPNQWRSINQIIMHLPLQTNTLEERLTRGGQIVMEDSMSVYILQVTDKRMSGEIMPLDYAREDIQQILLNDWQVGFMKNERRSMYDKAVRFNKLKRYER